ncbi:hypothetical protein [Komagataeibacter nataicola]|uniref:hypothetical protein n=1 Tax=Komagataeibacter nataicola TaxID=265960 RepID=UPI0011B5A4A8|nr:hypothetical protein [Komagataeibacter nataicola]WNM10362.1 hypothetical protein RI056_18855 [Komagataeibacter nataicola]GBR20893.1 hypothetical protein AA0616_1903 [Komagataeibacter nataicola NRIC 0616]
MTRDVFIPRAGTPVTTSSSIPSTSAPVAQVQISDSNATDDPLASAFPEWDLLPATQFVRRR